MKTELTAMRLYCNVRYARVGGRDLLLDAYLPPKKPAPDRIVLVERFFDRHLRGRPRS
jgi:hypothetical protein